jgi:hypothetical protein
VQEARRPMKIPYGISNFKSLREQGYLYVDKTMYIKSLENLNSKYIFFIRPRRFGKSLFLSTLEHYYDVNAEEDFQKLFGDLYIGKNPTVFRNQYLILKMNFSGLNTSSKEELKKSFHLRMLDSIINFLNRYNSFFTNMHTIKEKIENTNDTSSVFIKLIDAVKATGKKVYLIIDEYDHFANDIIAMGENNLYKNIIRASGFVRDFYETVKIGTETVIDRIFITGISPIMLDDLTSGFNIAMNITMDQEMNEMLGFTREEVSGICDKLGIGQKEIDIKIKEYYDGYLFHPEGNERLYNPDMMLYFLDQYIRKKRMPERLIDDNVKMDYGRLNRLTVNKENKKMLEKIIQDESITSDIVTRFSFDRMYDQDYFISLLFYMGLLTIDRRERTRLVLKIPNYVIKTVFWEYIADSLKKDHGIKIDTAQLKKAIEDMAYNGTIEPFITYVSQNILKFLSNRDMIDFDEKYIKVILLSLLNISPVYIPVSEREVETGYIDIYLERDMRTPDVKYEWILELKYIKKSESQRPDFAQYIAKIKAEGLEQMERYKKSRRLEAKKNLKQALLIFIGKDKYEIVEK